MFFNFVVTSTLEITYICFVPIITVKSCEGFIYQLEEFIRLESPDRRSEGVVFCIIFEMERFMSVMPIKISDMGTEACKVERILVRILIATLLLINKHKLSKFRYPHFFFFSSLLKKIKIQRVWFRTIK